ncbi:MAG: metal-dependent phosphohydrolase [Ornithinibacter sp.]|nr:metal-dependent phosphohydrolase [Ornithinibacter sp.]
MTRATPVCHSGRMDRLRGRWRADCALVAPGAEARVVDDLGRDLLRRWREPHRRYHDATHLLEVLSAVDTLCAREGVAPQDRAVAALAVWFHDAVYAVRTPRTNEAESAALAAEALALLGADAATTERVTDLVLSTATHELRSGTAQDITADVVHDADLWVLGAPVSRFDEYCRQVREEYADVPAGEYASARSAVLRPFLVRPHVYRTTHGRRSWETAARENLARELSRLAA